MINTRIIRRLLSIFICVCLLFSLTGCLAFDNSSGSGNQETETEYRHIKNTTNNYIYNNSNEGNDSSDYQEQPDSTFKPDNMIPDNSGNNNNNESTNTDGDNNDNNNNNEDELPPEINYDDVIEIPETDIFSEDFESYGEEGTEISCYTIGGGDPLTVTVEKSDAPQGEFCGKFYSTLGSKQYSSVYYNFTKENGEEYDFQNWKDQKYISFWAKQDGSARKLIIGINDGVNNARATFEVTSEWVFYQIPLSDFVPEDFTITNVVNLHMTWSGGIGATYIDDLQVTEKEIKVYDKFIARCDANTIENGEFYEGDDLGVKAAYGLVEGDEYSTLSIVSLDGTEKVGGEYSLKFTSTPEENKTYSAYTASLEQSMVVRKFNDVTLNIKGDGSENQKISVMLFDGDTQVAGSEFAITDEWASYTIDTVIPQDSSRIKFNRIAITTSTTDNENTFYIDDFVISNKDGVLETPENIIENGEYYSNSFTVLDAYTNNAETADVTVELDSSVKNAGDNSISFTVPAAQGEETTSEVIYDFQTKTIPVNSHIRLKLNAVGLHGIANVKFDVLDADENIVASLATEVSNKTNWEEMYIANNSSEDIYVDAIRIIFGRGTSSYKIWMDDLEIFAPEGGKLPAEITDIIQDTKKVSAGNNHATVTLEEIFAIPKDCSGSEGNIVVTRSVKYNTRIRLVIYTENGNSTEYDSGYCDISDTSLTTIIPLADIGLTDEDMACVTGYQIKFNTSSSIPQLDFSITVPKTQKEPETVVTDVIQEQKRITVNSGKEDTTEVIFDTPLDCSGSNGYIILSDTLNNVHAVELKIYTANTEGTTKRIGVSNRNGTGAYNNIIPLSDLGLTDEDLACITGYDIKTDSATATVYYDYTITVPRKIDVDSVKTKTIKESTTIETPNTNWSSKITTEFFDAPLDCSGSDGFILFEQDSKVKTKVTFTLYTATGSSNRIIMDNSQVQSSSETSTKISLSELGLTDEQLNNVIGYQVIFSVSSSVASRTYSITVPDVPQGIKTDIIQEENRLTVNSGKTDTTKIRFDTPLDCSGSNGYLVLNDRLYGVHAVTIRLYTTNKMGNSYRIGSSNRNGTSGKYNYIIPLSSMGLTDEDIASITGYDITTDGSSATVYYDYSITVPRKNDTPAIKTTTVKDSVTVSLPNTNWSSKETTEFFDTPLDCSGSNGYVLFEQDSKVKTKITFTLYTASGSSNRIIMDNSQVSNSTETTTQISLADLGLTDEQLSEVIGYQVIFSVSSSVSSRTYSITIPQ